MNFYTTVRNVGIGILVVMAACSALFAEETPVHDLTGPLSKERYQAIAGHILQLSESDDAYLFRYAGQKIEFSGITAKTVDASGFKEQRAMGARLWLQALAVVKNRMDPDFNFKKLPTLNIAPSDIRYPSGISPKGIKDPRVRAEYEAALQANAEWTKRYSVQICLKRLAEKWPECAFRFIRSNFDDSPEDKRELQTIFAEELTDEDCRRWLEAAFQDLDQKYVVISGGMIEKSPQKPESKQR